MAVVVAEVAAVVVVVVVEIVAVVAEVVAAVAVVVVNCSNPSCCSDFAVQMHYHTDPCLFEYSNLFHTNSHFVRSYMQKVHFQQEIDFHTTIPMTVVAVGVVVVVVDDEFCIHWCLK